MRYLTLSILLLCIGCVTPDKELAIDHFDKEYVLSEYKEVFSDKDTFIGNIRGVMTYDDMLIARISSGDYFFVAIDIQKKQFEGAIRC